MIEINKKKLCESCFCEADEEPCPNCGFSAAKFCPDPLVLPMGTRLDDKIVIGRVMGKGGFGITYLGYDLRMDKTIAVKEYYPNGIAYRSSGTEVSIANAKSAETFEKGAEKFYNEAEMVAQFNGNPNIVSVYDYFRANNTVYLVMEFLQGVTLKKYVKSHGKLTDGQALFIMDKIAAALSITHSAGVLHRDISPDNIMICKDGKVKLIDFGAARQIMAESSSNLTVVMKPGYTPIEQYTKKGRQGAWTDIYSLGVSIYYALTEVIIDDPYARMDNDNELTENTRGINNDLWNILKKCTMIDSADRYRSAIDLRKALKSVSAPVKAEPIVLTDNDFNEESEAVPEKTESPQEEIDDFPVTVEDSEKAEVTRHFETEINSSTGNDEAVKEALSSSVKSSDGAAGKTKSKMPFILSSAAAAVLIVTIGIIAIAEKMPNYPDDAGVSTVTVIETVKSDTETSAQKKSKTKKSETQKPETQKYVVPAIKDGKIIIDKTDLLWSMTKSISKDTLLCFDGDIRVTLKLKNVNLVKGSDGNYNRSATVLIDGKASTPNVTPISIDVVDKWGGFFFIENGVDELVFIIPDSLKKDTAEKLEFDMSNCVVETVTLEEEAYDKTIVFDGKYPNDWMPMKTTIPIEELNCYDGNVRITVDTEIGTFASDKTHYIQNDDDNIIIPLSFIQIADNTSQEKLNVSADNLRTPVGDEMYPLCGTGKRKFSFVITKEELSRCSESLCFQVYNCVVKKVYIKGVDAS